jgi:hypothetical protein
MQECRPVTPQDVRMIQLSRGDGIPIHLPSVIRPNKSPLWDKHPTIVGERGNDSSSCFMLTMGRWEDRGGELISGVDPCSLQGPPIEWMEGRGEYFLSKSWSLIHWTCWDMNLERAFIIQGPHRSISRTIKNGLARAAYLGIQILQNPVTPKKTLSYFMA